MTSRRWEARERPTVGEGSVAIAAAPGPSVGGYLTAIYQRLQHADQGQKRAAATRYQTALQWPILALLVGGANDREIARVSLLSRVAVSHRLAVIYPLLPRAARRIGGRRPFDTCARDTSITRRRVVDE